MSSWLRAVEWHVRTELPVWNLSLPTRQFDMHWYIPFLHFLYFFSDDHPQPARLSAPHASERPISVCPVTVVSSPQAVNASLLVHPIRSLPPVHVPPATRIARPVLALRLLNVQAVHPTGLYSQTAVALQRAPRPNFSTLPVEAVSNVIAVVRVVPVPAQVTALPARARARSSAEGLVRLPTAGMGRPLCPALACVFRILSRQGLPSPSRFRASPGSTRRLSRAAAGVWRGGRYCS